VYPADLVAANLPPVTVTALLIVDARGRVKEVRIARQATDDALHLRFDDAVRKAAMAWRFAPMRIADWVEDAQGNERRVSADPKPFSQTYRFRFDVKDGKPRVLGGVPASGQPPQR
jgi:TonB family protein